MREQADQVRRADDPDWRSSRQRCRSLPFAICVVVSAASITRHNGEGSARRARCAAEGARVQCYQAVRLLTWPINASVT